MSTRTRPRSRSRNIISTCSWCIASLWLKSVSAENGVPATSVAGSSTRPRVSTLPWIQPPCTAKWSVIGLDGHAFDGGSAALPRPV
jgi:hypothetical protein